VTAQTTISHQKHIIFEEIGIQATFDALKVVALKITF